MEKSHEMTIIFCRSNFVDDIYFTHLRVSTINVMITLIFLLDSLKGVLERMRNLVSIISNGKYLVTYTKGLLR